MDSNEGAVQALKKVRFIRMNLKKIPAFFLVIHLKNGTFPELNLEGHLSDINQKSRDLLASFRVWFLMYP